MKILINHEVIKKLKPCEDRYENYLNHYADFEGNIEDFLDFPLITHEDKLWVSLRLIPRFLIEVFSVDCAVNAYAYADAYAAAAYAAAAYAAYAADAAAAYAAYAADAADAAAASYAYAAKHTEKQRQIESLIYLIQNH